MARLLSPGPGPGAQAALLLPLLCCFARWASGAQVGPPTAPADTAALQALNDEVVQATGSGIPGWFPANQSEPCGDYIGTPRVLPFPGVLCPLPRPGQASPLSVLSLVLYNTGITASSIEPIAGLLQLTGLTLLGNNFSGPIPASFSRLSRLSNLDLSSNHLSGPIPDLSALPLRLLLLSNQTSGGAQGLTGGIPASLSTMTSLVLIDLGFNSLSGPIPEFLTALPKLENLILRGNQLAGQIPDLSPLAPTLRLLDVSRNPFAPQPMPGFLNALTLLNGVLDLSYMNLEGGLVDLSDLGAVTDLILNGNQLSGPLTPGLLPFGSLGYLSIRNNRFSGKIPNRRLLGVLNNNIYCLITCGVDFANNSFSGRLPPALGNILQAFVFDFSHNRLSGPIPNKYGYVYSMLQLKLQGNRLTGRLPDFNPPPSVTYQLSLAQLNTSSNALWGSVPEHLSRFTRLQQIDLSRNRLYGTLPTLAVLSRLSFLSLARNLLSGVPTPFPSARVLDLSSNFFGGAYSSLTANYSAGAVQLSAQLNCFTCSAHDCAAAPQRSATMECRAFCNAATVQPPCGGLGTCALWARSGYRGRRKPSCRCNAGAVASGSSCVAGP